ncbi:hypothetical protein SKAU_G00088250 [Synaphobranchus kaupii]|uniref:Uncharacterized protein n=1 Tax=Synaphobranchus kaupii TaxID=118154 RepID=A0A9Q1FWL0_SYNKA|nr:hypothetical protein SKAU_G00088250 [Synaphobranchus kaupii]
MRLTPPPIAAVPGTMLHAHPEPRSLSPPPQYRPPLSLPSTFSPPSIHERTADAHTLGSGVVSTVLVVPREANSPQALSSSPLLQLPTPARQGNQCA